MATSPRRPPKSFVPTALAYLVTVAVIVAAVLGGDWEKIAHHFFNVELMRDMLPEVITVAARNTVLYTLASFSIGLVLALGLALMRMSSFVPFRAFALGYIELFRGLPALVTLILLAFGIPIAFASSKTNGWSSGGVDSNAVRKPVGSAFNIPRCAEAAIPESASAPIGIGLYAAMSAAPPNEAAISA